MTLGQNDNDKTQTHVVLTKGTMVSHYRIVEKIGAGGMGEVYLAEDTELDRKVALKFLPTHLCQDEDCRRRFKREAQATAKLGHPNIVTIHEVGEYNGRPFFAMEHVEGQSFTETIEKTKLPMSRILELAIQMCEGLQEAHGSGVVHRDIKPSNMIIDKKGNLRILDFGLATIRGGEKLTKTGSTLGTLRYMSPEQARGEKVDHRSDLFSFGAVFYEMITGRSPFKGEVDAEEMYQVLNETPEPLSRYRSNIPEGLQLVVSKLLEKDPGLRYQSAAGVVADFKRLQVATEPRRSRLTTTLIGAATVVALVAGGYFVYSSFILGGRDEDDRPKRIAVLPFENLGDPEDEYFADGITDEITSRLTVTDKLHVISRTSSMQYKDTDKGLAEIAKELNVDYILEGTIRWDKSGDTSRVRITPQLIQVTDDRHLWAQNYERTLTQVFAVQADIATSVTEALDVTLLEPQRRSIETKPTDNMEAYEYYLRGNEYFHRGYDISGYAIALKMYEKAIELDSGFAEAWAALSITHSWFYWVCEDCTQDRMEMARQTAHRSLELAPDLAEAHLALARYYYHTQLDYERAVLECEVALQSQPNNAYVLFTVGIIRKRQGRWDEALTNQKKATELSPRFHVWSWELGQTLLSMRRYQEAIAAFDRSLAIAPENASGYISNKAYTLIAWTGDVSKAREVVRDGFEWADSSDFFIRLLYLDLLDRDYSSALARITREPNIAWVYLRLQKCMACAILGEDSLAAVYCDSLRVMLEEDVPETEWRLSGHHSRLGLMYSALGRHKEAVREGELAAQLLPIEKDAVSGARVLRNLAVVYARAGEHDLAIDLLEQLLSIPSRVSVPLLRLEPEWDPLRDHPRFQTLLEKYEKIHGM